MIKEFEKQQRNKGVTLVALVITIIVLLILAGVSIATLVGENGILLQATNAKEANRAGTVDDEVKLWKSEWIIYNKIGKTGTLPKDEEAMLNDLITRKLVNDIAQGNEIDRENKIIKINGREIPYAIEEITTENKEYTDENGKKAIIPKGFEVSNVEGEKQIDKGLVVIAPDGSEFVWIPVDKNTLCVDGTTGKEMAKLQNGSSTNYEGVLYDFSGTTSTKRTRTEITGTGNREPAFLTDPTDGDANNNIGLTQATLQSEYNEIIKSIKKYGGFYVGRYESSLSDSTNTTAATTGNIQSKKEIMPTSAANSGTNKWYGLYDKQQKYSQVIAESNIKSSMIYGSQYDTMLNWALNGADKAKVTVNTNGNHGGRVQPTKSMSNDKINNIYDLEGNLCEWTAEAYNTSGRVVRGGDYFNRLLPSDRVGMNPNRAYSEDGSRITLYL